MASDEKVDQDMIDLALMIRRLVARLTKHEPDSQMCKQAIDLLERKGIKSWPLR